MAKKQNTTQNTGNIVTNSIKTLKMVHIKKKIFKKEKKRKKGFRYRRKNMKCPKPVKHQ